MRLAPLLVTVLFALLICGGGEERTALAYFLPSSYANTSLAAVACGSYGQQCPDSSPICCGISSLLYCVSAGSTCCTARYPSWSNSLASCAQGQVCCAGDARATCCDSGAICRLQKSATGLVEPHCVYEDSCNVFKTADSCLHADVDGTPCGWCCEEQRCTVATDNSTGLRSRCMDGSSTAITRGEQCASTCSYANTCELCEGVYQSADTAHDPCTWCCATMSCMPKSQTAAHCENNQVVPTLGQCEECLFNGRGVNERVTSETDSILETIFSISLFVALVVVVVVWRLVYDCAFGTDDDLTSTVPALNPQEVVRRYGFQRTDRAPSSPVHRHHSRLPTQASETDSALYQCCLCKRQLSLVHLKAHLEGIGSGSNTSVPAAATNASTIELPVSQETQKGTPSTAAPAPDSEMDGHSAAVGTEMGAAPNRETARADDDAVVVFLPCEHMVCLDCLGLHSSNSGGNSQKSGITASNAQAPRQQQGTAPVTTTTTTATAVSSDSIEKAVLTRWKNKCPVCHEPIEDTMIPGKIISL